MKPIIFSTPMVQAILDNRKTMTRRVIKIDDAPENWKISIAGTYIVRTEPYGIKLPCYAAGDILWVRETWSKDENGEYVYRANYGTTEDDSFPPSMFKWKPSIHMPREAARIFLKVTNVRVERLQDITEEDAKAEGMESEEYLDHYEWAVSVAPPGSVLPTLRSAFAALWDSLNAKRGYSWETNPWVWVIEFEVCDKTQTYRRAHEVLGR
jgi:hypothetical protein